MISLFVMCGMASAVNVDDLFDHIDASTEVKSNFLKQKIASKQTGTLQSVRSSPNAQARINAVYIFQQPQPSHSQTSIKTRLSKQ